MGKQLYYEDVQEGMELPPLVKETSALQLLQYASASRDFYLAHHDPEFARSVGLPNIIIQGSLKSAFLGQLVTGWIGEWGTLKQLEVQYRGIDVPGKPLTAKGTVTKKYEHDGEHVVECAIWTENVNGERTTRGSAIVALPSRGATDRSTGI